MAWPPAIAGSPAVVGPIGRNDEGKVVATGPGELKPTIWSPAKLAGAPSASFAGRTVATVTEGRIALLVDEYEAAAMDEMMAWLREHAPDLDASYV